MLKRFLIFTLFSALFINLSANLLHDIVDGNFKSKSTPNIRSMNDGEHYTVLENSKHIVKYSYKTGKAVDTIFNAEKTKLNKLTKIKGYELSPNEMKILVYNEQNFRYRRTFTANYYVFDVKRNELKPLSEGGEQEVPLFSPDSRYIAFARENNLYLHKLDFGTESAITKDGEFGKIINGTPDWVYEEEFVATRYFVFSPDSKLLAFVKFDERDAPTYQMQRYLDGQIKEDSIPLYPTFQSFKYPKPGQPNSKVSVYVYDDFYKSVKKVDLGAATKEDCYIPRLKWTKDQNKLAVFILNRNQNQLDMVFANPKTLLSKLILRESVNHYYEFENLDGVHFSEDGNFFTFISERTGWRQVFLYNINGTLHKQFTNGKWDITKVYGFNANNQTLYYQSAENSPLQRDVYSIDMKGKKVQLTDGKGTHEASFSSDFSYMIDVSSSINYPETTSLIATSKGIKIRTIETNEQLFNDFKQLNLPQKEFFSFTTSEGIQLNGWILKPKNISSNEKLPLLMTQYSGPNSQEVKDKWNIGWEYYLATQGYVIASIDGRGTGARGTEFRKSTYLQLGVLETKDQIEAAKYLGKLPFVDAKKIGIWGWSYGGFMTLNAMSSGEPIFKAGIAIAPVTNWLLYNSAYTERFMQQPQQNMEGYAKGSPLSSAKNLHGNLLIIHGTADDNVHVQNTYLYLNELQKNGKNASLFLYTDKNHSILGKETRRHLYQLNFDFLEKNLKAEK